MHFNVAQRRAFLVELFYLSLDYDSGLSKIQDPDHNRATLRCNQDCDQSVCANSKQFELTMGRSKSMAKPGTRRFSKLFLHVWFQHVSAKVILFQKGAWKARGYGDQLADVWQRDHFLCGHLFDSLNCMLAADSSFLEVSEEDSCAVILSRVSGFDMLLLLL